MIDLRHHGDAELAPGLVDLAVNVRAGTPPRNCGPCCTRRWTTAPVIPTPAPPAHCGGGSRPRSGGGSAHREGRGDVSCCSHVPSVHGATPRRRLVRTTLADLPRTVVAEAIRPPAVWVVGDVVGLHPMDAFGGER
jgi:hypothetical protein